MESSFDIFTGLEQALSLCGEYVTQVSGMSMYPMLRYRRDPVLIHPAEGELKRYDVAVYNRGDGYVIHRILEVRPDCYVFRGDNCIGKEIIPKSRVAGVVAGFWRAPRPARASAAQNAAGSGSPDASGHSLSGRYVPVTNLCYRIYSRLWVALNPVNVRLVGFAQTRVTRVMRKVRRLWA